MPVALWLDRLNQWDVAGVRLIRGTLQNGFFDFLMPFISNKWNFTAPFGLLLLYVFLFRQKRDQILAISAVGVVLLVDATTQLLKLLFQRIRPCHVLQQLELIRGASCGGSFSFPSNHASNVFALAAFISYNYPRLTIPCFAAAGLVGYSRVYVGAHYPIDVLAGLSWGVLLGLAAAVLADRLIRVGRGQDQARVGVQDDRSSSSTSFS